MKKQGMTRHIGSMLLFGLVLGFAAAPVAAQEEPAGEQAAAAQPVAEEAAPATPAPAPAPAEPQMAEAQKIFRTSSTVVLDGKAEANGVLTMIFEPNGGEAKQVRINVLAKTKAKNIGKDLANQFTFTVGTGYKVKGKDNKVTIKAKDKKSPPFWIGIGEQALTGVSVRVTK